MALLIAALATWLRPSASITDAPAASPPLVPNATDAPPPAKAPIGLSGGAPSIDALLDQFLAAVEQKDTDALHRLRVTKAEFQEIIVPGTVTKGLPPRHVSEQPQEFFWSLNDAKSRYFAEELFARFGGRHYVERRLSFTKGTREYAWYTAHGQVQLALRPADDPHFVKLRTGTIAEVDGTYKFISFQWEN